MTPNTKTKLGISYSLMGAALYFLYIYSGMLALLIATLYVFLREDNQWLKQTAIRSLVIACFFSGISLCIGLVPSAINLLYTALDFLNEEMDLTDLYQFSYFIRDIVSFAEKIFFFMLGMKALKGQNMPFGAADKILMEHFPAE